MTLKEVFLPNTIEPDTAETRTCGTCNKPLALDKFYKDGTDKEGNPKYRRDCKDCYRSTRLLERRNKKQPLPTKKSAQRRK
jgi:hypothetical protein